MGARRLRTLVSRSTEVCAQARPMGHHQHGLRGELRSYSEYEACRSLYGVASRAQFQGRLRPSAHDPVGKFHEVVSTGSLIHPWNNSSGILMLKQSVLIEVSVGGSQCLCAQRFDFLWTLGESEGEN